MLVSNISQLHRTPTRHEKDIRCKFNQDYKKLKQTKTINNIITKIGTILHEADKEILIYNKEHKDQPIVEVRN